MPEENPKIQKLVDKFQSKLEKIDKSATCKVIVYPKDAAYINILTRDAMYYPSEK